MAFNQGRYICRDMINRLGYLCLQPCMLTYLDVVQLTTHHLLSHQMYLSENEF